MKVVENTDSSKKNVEKSKTTKKVEKRLEKRNLKIGIRKSHTEPKDEPS